MENLISDQQKRDIAQSLYALDIAQQVIDKAREAGIECDERDARCRHLKETLLRMQQSLGSPKSRKNS